MGGNEMVHPVFSSPNRLRDDQNTFLLSLVQPPVELSDSIILALIINPAQISRLKKVT